MIKTWSAYWNRVRAHVTLTDLLLDITGKFLVGLGVGAWCARTLAPYQWWLIGLGIACSVFVKLKYWKRFGWPT